MEVDDRRVPSLMKTNWLSEAPLGSQFRSIGCTMVSFVSTMRKMSKSLGNFSTVRDV